MNNSISEMVRQEEEAAPGYLTEEELTELADLCTKIPAGPWEAVQFQKEFGARNFIVHDDPDAYPSVVATVLQGFATSEFIVAARDAVPRLIQEVKAARRTAEELNQRLAEAERDLQGMIDDAAGENI